MVRTKNMAAYKIKDLETLTGIKAHTIRIWEKRYGIIEPDRTETQIRSYTDEELALILKVSFLNKRGFKISKIARMSHAQISNAVWDLKETDSEDSSLEMLVLALLNLDEQLFKNTFQRLIDQYGLEKAFIDVILPFLKRIGVMWLVGTITPAQEHFISNLIRQKLIAAIDKIDCSEHTIENPVVLYLPEHEWHEISLLFYAYCIKFRGIPMVYLGQSLPYDSLVDCIHRMKPNALVTSWLTAVDPNFMRSYFKQLKEEFEEIAIFAGGYQIDQNYAELENWVNKIESIDYLVDNLKN